MAKRHMLLKHLNHKPTVAVIDLSVVSAKVVVTIAKSFKQFEVI